MNVETFIMILAAVVVGWCAFGVTNRYLYPRIFGDEQGAQMQRDLVVCLGPMGFVVLIMCAGLMAYLKVCEFFGGRPLGR